MLLRLYFLLQIMQMWLSSIFVFFSCWSFCSSFPELHLEHIHKELWQGKSLTEIRGLQDPRLVPSSQIKADNNPHFNDLCATHATQIPFHRVTTFTWKWCINVIFHILIIPSLYIWNTFSPIRRSQKSSSFYVSKFCGDIWNLFF